MSGDSRKDFLLTTIANHFGIPPSDSPIKNLLNLPEVNNFLDDGNRTVLISILQEDNQIQVYNELHSNSPNEKCLMFFKIKPEAITPESLHHNLVVSSMFDSPVTTLYHSIKKIYGPLILNSDVSNKSVDPKLQNLLSELENGLAAYLRKTSDNFGGKNKNNKESFMSILTPYEEFQYWNDLADSGDERAKSFKESFEKGNYQFIVLFLFF